MAEKPMNILFVMYDQLRFDYLSCAGHPHLQTPNFDRVAAKGVRFTNAYAQSTSAVPVACRFIPAAMCIRMGRPGMAFLCVWGSTRWAIICAARGWIAG